MPGIQEELDKGVFPSLLLRALIRNGLSNDLLGFSAWAFFFSGTGGPAQPRLGLVTGWNVRRSECPPGSASDPLCPLPSLRLRVPICTTKETDKLLVKNLPAQSLISMGS